VFVHVTLPQVPPPLSFSNGEGGGGVLQLIASLTDLWFTFQVPGKYRDVWRGVLEPHTWRMWMHAALWVRVVLTSAVQCSTGKEMALTYVEFTPDARTALSVCYT
jgi:hypothetical protein